MSRACARLLRQNAALRESIAREFQPLAADALGAGIYHRAMRAYEAKLVAASNHNDSALKEILGPPKDAALREQLTEAMEWLGLASSSGVYDGLGSLWRHCAKDWTAEGVAGTEELRSHVLELVRAEVDRVASSGSDEPAARVLIPGCGQARLAWAIATAPWARTVQVTGLERSEATLGFARYILECAEKDTLSFHPWLDAFPNCWDEASRLASVRVPDVSPSMPPNLELVHADFDEWASLSRSDSAGLSADAQGERESPRLQHVCVTHFFLDCVDDLVSTMRAIHDVLVPGGAWVFAGPLHFHQGAEYIPRPHPPLSHLLHLAADLGFVLESEPVLLRAPYVCRPNAFLHEADWRAPCFVARRA